MKRLEHMATAQKSMTQISDGAFLTVKSGKDVNSMTIGWALMGYVWNRPIMMVAVRPSRHTFSIIDRSGDFTVSVPSSDMSRELSFCGTRSGRNCDKFRECGLNVVDARKVRSPIINIPGTHYECRIVLKSRMNPKFLICEYDELYPKRDYHTFYFGEIEECYEIESRQAGACSDGVDILAQHSH